MPVEQEVKHVVELDFLDKADEEESSNDDSQREISTIRPEQPPRRSKRMRRPPNYCLSVANELPKEPITVEEAFSSPDKGKWRGAMATEMKSLEENDVWELVELPEGRKALGSKWVNKVKTDAGGCIEHYKVRLVAQGFSQKFGTDYDKKFCPVARLESFRTLVTLAVQHGLKLHQVDVTTGFFNGELEEEV